MPELKPVMGYRSRREAARAMSRTMRPFEIAKIIGGKSNDIAALIRARRTIHFPPDVIEQLEPAARKRGLTVSKLAAKIITVVSDEEMVDAILDDGGGT